MAQIGVKLGPEAVKDGNEKEPAVFVSTHPPIARDQAPPPCWSGTGSPGAEMKADVLVKNAVLTVSITDVKAFTPLPLPNGKSWLAETGVH